MTPNQYTPEEPISSIATALAPAALGIVRVSGKGCIDLVSKVFSRPKALLEAPGNTLVYGWITDCPVKPDNDNDVSSLTEFASQTSQGLTRGSASANTNEVQRNNASKANLFITVYFRGKYRPIPSFREYQGREGSRPCGNTCTRQERSCSSPRF